MLSSEAGAIAAFEGTSTMNPFVRLLFAALAILLPLAGCSSPGSDLPPLPATQGSSPYRLGPGDKLDIKVLGADELVGQYEVQGDGTIRMLLLGDVPAAGLTAESLEDNISGKLKAGGFITKPSVSVSVLTYRPFYILGEVAKPGAYAY